MQFFMKDSMGKKHVKEENTVRMFAIVGAVPSGPGEVAAVWPQPHCSTCLL